MADRISIGAAASHKPNPTNFPSQVPVIDKGIVRHPAVTPDDQLRILAAVDDTGTASLGDIAEALPGHSSPIAAVLALVEAGVLVVLSPGMLDQHTLVARGPEKGNPTPAHNGDVPPAPLVSPSASAPLEGIEPVPTSGLVPLIYRGVDVRPGAFGRIPSLNNPGVYILRKDGKAYVGYGKRLADRIGCTNGLKSPNEIIAIVDAHNGLTEDDAKVCERQLWSRLASCREVRLENANIPDGAAVEPARFEELQLFLSEAALVLRHAGILFCEGSARTVIAGPRAEPGRLAPLRHLEEVPPGEILELNFHGLVALAARQDDGRWLALRGSEARPDVVKSANASASYLRAEWIRSGILVPSGSGEALCFSRDVWFDSGGACGHFLSGSKGKGLAAWRPIDLETVLSP